MISKIKLDSIKILFKKKLLSRGKRSFGKYRCKETINTKIKTGIFFFYEAYLVRKKDQMIKLILRFL